MVSVLVFQIRDVISILFTCSIYNCRCSTMVSALVFQTRDASSILVTCSIYNCSDGVAGGARRLAKAKAFASSILVHCSKYI